MSSGFFTNSVASGTSFGMSGCLLSDIWVRIVTYLSVIHCCFVLTTEDQDQPQRPMTSPRSTASRTSLPPG